MLRPKKLTITKVKERIDVQHRISLGLVSLSLGVVTLSLAVAFFTVPPALAPKLFTFTVLQAQAVPSTATAVTLTWTAPGDDGTTGQAASYDLRYSGQPITDDNFASCSSAIGVPVPAVAGSTESFTVNDLEPASTYYFAVKTYDEVGNLSPISNVATKTTASLPAACVPEYHCTDWTACLEKIQTRTCTVTNNCPAGLDQPIISQACVTPEPVPVTPPTTPPGTDTPPTTPPETSPTTPPGTGTPLATPPTGGERVTIDEHLLVAGLAPGGLPKVRFIDPTTGQVKKEITVFSERNRNGVSVAAGDLDGDHQADIAVGTGVGSKPTVVILNTNGTTKGKIIPYPTSAAGGVSVAMADVNGDGTDELITVLGQGSAQIKVYKYQSDKKKFQVIAQGFAYAQKSNNGFNLAAGDTDLDGRAEIAVTPRRNASSVTIIKISGQKIQKVKTFKPYPINFRNGIIVAAGDVNGDGRDEIITTGSSGYWSHVKIFNSQGRKLVSFLPASKAYFGGVTLTALDVNEDGRDEVLTATYSHGDPGVRIFRYSGLTKKFERINDYLVFPRKMQLGLRLGSA